MSDLAERLARGLHEIADGATPAPTAWESIRAGIDELTDKPDVEVEMLQPNSRKPRRMWATLGVVAASMVVITVGIAAWVGSNDDPDPSVSSDPAQQAVDVAQGFIAARDAWDAERVRSLVADDAVIEMDSTVAAPDDYLANAEFERILGWRFMEPACTVIAAGPPTEVTCTYTTQNVLTEALGVAPYTGNSFEFVIADGQIQHVTNELVGTAARPGGGVINQYASQVLTQFISWLDATYPGDFNVMFDNIGGWSPDDVILSAESLALWEQRTIEFVASLGDSQSTD